jgi:hypothetical protein
MPGSSHCYMDVANLFAFWRDIAQEEQLFRSTL